jgi:hypothetical protein
MEFKVEGQDSFFPIKQSLYMDHYLDKLGSLVYVITNTFNIYWF